MQGLTLAGGVADAQNIVDILRYHSNLHRVEKQGDNLNSFTCKTLFIDISSKQRISIHG